MLYLSKEENSDKINESINAAKNLFLNSVEILLKQDSSFELQKTLFEYSRFLYKTKNYIDAEIIIKSVIFDAINSKNYELLVKGYLLLGDLELKKEDITRNAISKIDINTVEYMIESIISGQKIHFDQNEIYFNSKLMQYDTYECYLKALENADFDSAIYMRTCYQLIFRMQKMNKNELESFIELLRDQNKDQYFDTFLESLKAKINGEDYTPTDLPISLMEELKNFN